jgi:hypothetical protein
MAGRTKNPDSQHQRFEECCKERAAFLSDLQVFKDCDPIMLAERKIKSKVAKSHANRWTDNIFSVKSWMNKNMNVDSSMFHGLLKSGRLG